MGVSAEVGLAAMLQVGSSGSVSRPPSLQSPLGLWTYVLLPVHLDLVLLNLPRRCQFGLDVVVRCAAGLGESSRAERRQRAARLSVGFHGAWDIVFRRWGVEFDARGRMKGRGLFLELITSPQPEAAR